MTERIDIRVTKAELALVDGVVAKLKTPDGEPETTSTWGRREIVAAAERERAKGQKRRPQVGLTVIGRKDDD